MKKILFFTTTCILLILNAMAFDMTANDAQYTIEPGQTTIGGCYQTMGYCSGTLTYVCKTSYTADLCRRYAPGCKWC